MIETLAAANTAYFGLFPGDWMVFGLAGGIFWAFKDSFSFGPRNDDDDEQHYY